MLNTADDIYFLQVVPLRRQQKKNHTGHNSQLANMQITILKIQLAANLQRKKVSQKQFKIKGGRGNGGQWVMPDKHFSEKR
jgi:hypothetical protein